MYTELLANYTRLIKRIDDHIGRLHRRYPDDIACKKGCDACCRHLSLFPVEAVNISLAFSRLVEPEKQRVFQRINTTPGGCPLLIDHTCCLYNARPVICRTHGYPITMKKSGQLEIDFCPDNFCRITGFQNEDLLSLEQVNTTLMAINHHFISEIDTDMPLPERIRMADALSMLS